MAQYTPLKAKYEVHIPDNTTSTLTITLWLGYWRNLKRVLLEGFGEDARELVDGIDKAIEVENERYRKEKFGEKA